MTARHVQETRFALTPDSPASLPDDGALLLAWSRGRDEAAFTRFVQRHLGMVQGAALRKTSRPELAEEVAQSVFALAARRAAALATHPCPAAWLHRSAVLESANALRRELKHRRIAAVMLSQPDTSPEAGLPDAALPHLDDALNALNETDRRAVLLRFGEKLSYDQMAARLGKSADACQKQTSRALDRLRTVLSRRVAGITAVALVTALTSTLTTPASAAAAGKVSAAALAAAPKISLAALLHHLLNTMHTGKQITAAMGVAALLAAVPLGQSYREAVSLRQQLAAPPVPAPPPLAEARLRTPVQPPAADPGIRVLPGCSLEEADRTVALLRALRGRLLTSSQAVEVSRRLMNLPESHLSKALEAMADFPGLLPAGLLRVMVFSRWGELNPEAALEAASTAKLDMITGQMVPQALAFGWMERDPRGLALWLRDHPESKMAGTLATTIGITPHLFDRETMQQLHAAVPSGYYPGKLELSWESGAEHGDVAAVARKLLAKAPDDHRRDELIADAARYMANADPKAALDFVLANPDPRGKYSPRALAETASSWARQDLPAAVGWAWEWIHRKEINNPANAVWKELWERSETEIIELASGAPDESSRLHAIEMTALQSTRDPEKSLRLIGTLPDESRFRAMALYGTIQANESVTRTSEWLNTLPDGPDKDAAIRGFAPIVAREDAEAAMIWAASLDAEVPRTELVRQLGREWFQKSPRAAQPWIESSEALTGADRAAILAKP